MAILTPLRKAQPFTPQDFAFNLREMFFGVGQQGAFYIPKPTVFGQQVLYQDSAATTPATADGDPVGWMGDLSGNGNHATQSTSADRPIYRTAGGLHWLEFNGVNDYLVINDSPALRQSDMSFILAYLSTSTSRQDVISNGDGGLFGTNNYIIGVDTEFQILPRTPTSIQVIASSSTGNAHVGSIISDGTNVSGRLDRGADDSRASTLGTDNEAGLNLGRRTTPSGNYFIGNLYGVMVVAGEAISESSRLDSEDYAANLAGITL